MSELIERFYIYQTRVSSVAAGVVLEGYPQNIRRDAPFCLRGIAAGFGGSKFSASSLASLRLADADAQYRSVNRLKIPAMINNCGYGGLPEPVFPQIIYPAGGRIAFDFSNDSADTMTDVKILFWGTELYQPGAVWAPTYPSCYDEMPYDYPTLSFSLTATQESLNNQLAVPNDGDFVVRSGQVHPDATGTATDWTILEIKLKDYLGQAYMNDYIHVDWLFGRTPDRPGLPYPEIYIPRGQNLYYDLRRNDPMTETVSGQIAFKGAKTWPAQVAG